MKILLSIWRFFKDQIQYANIIALSKAQLTDESRVNNVINSIRDINPDANIIATPWDELEAKDILDVAESNKGNMDISLDDHDHNHDEDSADTSFDYWSFETMKTYGKEELASIFDSLKNQSMVRFESQGSLLSTDKSG